MPCGRSSSAGRVTRDELQVVTIQYLECLATNAGIAASYVVKVVQSAGIR